MMDKARPTKVRRARRGIALLLVLGVITAASVLSWALLSSASLHAQLDVNAQHATSSRYLADSGVSYAMYYLRYPEKSPVALTNGPFNQFYAGQSNVSLWEDAGGLVDIVVTNTALNTFLIRSQAIVNGITQVSEAEVVIATEGYRVSSAAAFGGPIQLPSQVTVTGLVSTVGTITDSLGNVLSSLGGSTISVSASAVPVFSDLSLVTSTGVVASTGGTDRTYTMDGVTYVAERAPATITGTLVTSRPALNPANVWYSDTAVTLNGATIDGTLVLRSGSHDLTVQGTNTLTAKSSGLPALIAGKDIKLSHTTLKAARLNSIGVTYVRNHFNTTGTTLVATGLNFNGALIMGGATPKIEGTIGPMNITYNTTASQVRLTDAKEITGISVLRWSRL